MKQIKILHMYPDMLDLYGDSGNIEVLKFRCSKRNIYCVVDEYSISSENVNFSDYDLIYLGGGADLEQQLLANDLNSVSEDLKKAYNNGVFLLLICGGYQLMGQYYQDSNNKKIDGLGLFDYFTEASIDKSKRCIGNIIVEADLGGEITKVIGFENHGGQTRGVNKPFGKVLIGNGNSFDSSAEGFIGENVIATYLHGPLLSKNPKVADYVIEYCVNRHEDENSKLEKLDDELENQCREVLFQRFLNK